MICVAPWDILLVEDNPHDVELTLRAFRKSHLVNHVHVVRDGQAALDVLLGGESNPKLVLLDLKLPKIDGLDVLRRIKSDPATRPIPVVALTSSNDDGDIRRCYDLGVNSYIVKPVDFEKFCAAIGTLGVYWLAINRPFEGPAE